MKDSHLLGADSLEQQEDAKDDTYSIGSESIESVAQLSHSFSLLSIMRYGDDYEKCETLTDPESIKILKNLSPCKDDELKIKQELREFNRDKREQDKRVLENDLFQLTVDEIAKQRDIRQLRAYEDIYNTLLNLNIFKSKIEEQTTLKIQEQASLIKAFEDETFQKIVRKYPTINKILNKGFSECAIQLFQYLLINTYPHLKESKSFNENVSEQIWKYLTISDLKLYD